MIGFHLIRVGALGNVGRFAATDAVRYPRGSRVIVRTSRGLEVGEVLGPPTQEASRVEKDGDILRGMTIEDQLLEARLEKNRGEALDSCSRRMAESGIETALIDVEHLFDGTRLVFYFLGEVTEQLSGITQQLAEVYETKVQFRDFTKAVVEGCGPDCGTDDADGCQSCSSCAISSACQIGSSKK